ncbi:MAG: nucleoside 2-deoxyribosyltransferase [Candidatus Colwellbacteria bacterium]|nr:nucleoside 2-deoxyribosyltransferase [Candidatus Colwellbacteria bacterium]
MKSIAICGSSRFKPEIKEWTQRLEDLGVTVYPPYLVGNPDQDGWKNLNEEQKKFVALGLTHDHFYKIQMADVVFIYNKDGYAGNSTTLEIGYSVAMGKPIYALTEDGEICRHVLFREFISSPEELVKRLQ